MTASRTVIGRAAAAAVGLALALFLCASAAHAVSPQQREADEALNAWDIVGAVSALTRFVARHDTDD